MSTKLRPGQKIKLKSVEELLGVSNEESAMDIEIVKIRPFKDHPFKVVDDEKMQDLVESIRVNGILSPVLIRPIGNDIYEMVSGHRRMHAAMILGMDCVPAIIREMTDDEATVKMVDANIQREELLPSEKAFAYKMKMDAMRRQGYTEKYVPELALAAFKYPNAMVTMRSAFYFYGLTDVIPDVIDLATGRDAAKIRDKRVKQYFIPDSFFKEGIEHSDYKGYTLSIYSRERMLVELIRYKSKLPYDYYKEIVLNYRRILPTLDVQEIQDLTLASPKSNKVFEVLQAEVL